MVRGLKKIPRPTTRTANHKSLEALQKKAYDQVDNNFKWTVNDRVEDAKEEFVRKHQSWRTRCLKGGRRSPRFRILCKMCSKDALNRAVKLKTKQLEFLEKEFLSEINSFPTESRQVVKDVIETRKQEESVVNIDAENDAKRKAADMRKTAEIRGMEARVKEIDAEILRQKQSQQKKSKPSQPPGTQVSSSSSKQAKTSGTQVSSSSSKQAKTSGTQVSSSSSSTRKPPTVESQIPKHSSFIGIWKAVCAGSPFYVNVDAHGGVISREGYSEQFEILGNGTRGKMYAIQLVDERWEFSSMPGPGELIWIGKATGLISRWTKQSELPEHSGKGQIGREVPNRPAPKAKLTKVKPQATAPPEGRNATPVSPSLMPRQIPFQPTPDRKPGFTLSDTSTDLPSGATKSPFKADQSELLSDVSEFVEPPRRVTLPDPLIHGLPGSPSPSLDDLLEPSKTHLEELIDSEAYNEMEPFTKQGFLDTAF